MTSMPDVHGIPNLVELAEERARALSLGDLSVCEDERPPARALRSRLAELSLCADEGPPVEPSVCADENPTEPSVCADEELPPSDVRLKTDIEQVGTTVYGLPLYHFRYKTGVERFEGVMAQDVLKVMPDAVRTGEDGHYRVNYARLGIRMSRA
jgi:hypothetical protein